MGSELNMHGPYYLHILAIHIKHYSLITTTRSIYIYSQVTWTTFTYILQLDMGITQGYFVHKTRSWLLISIRLAFHSVRDLLGEELLSRQRFISCIGTGAVVIFCESASHP